MRRRGATDAHAAIAVTARPPGGPPRRQPRHPCRRHSPYSPLTYTLLRGPVETEGGHWIAVHNLGDEYLYVHAQHAGSEVISVAPIADITPTSTATAESARFRSSRSPDVVCLSGRRPTVPPGEFTVVRGAEALGASTLWCDDSCIATGSCGGRFVRLPAATSVVARLAHAFSADRRSRGSSGAGAGGRAAAHSTLPRGPRCRRRL
jgi:hypothetical protein